MRSSDWSSDVCSSDLMAAAAGIVIGYLTLRRTGIYFAMSTLAFGEMFFFLENSSFKEYTGGENGIAGVPPPNISLGFTTLHISSGWPMYCFVAGFFFIGYLIARRIVRSPFGAVLSSEEHTSELQSIMRNSYAVF